MKKNNERVEIIKDLVQANKFTKQTEILEALSKHDIYMTQATLSRYLRSLKIIKRPSVAGLFYYTVAGVEEPIKNTGIIQLSKNQGLTIEFSGQLAVIKTKPGYANAIAGEIDTHSMPAVIGTIAGDDTILLILREKYGSADIMDELSTFASKLFI